MIKFNAAENNNFQLSKMRFFNLTKEPETNFSLLFKVQKKKEAFNLKKSKKIMSPRPLLSLNFNNHRITYPKGDHWEID